MIENFQFAVFGANERNVKRASAKVVNQPLALWHLLLFTLVGIRKTSCDWLLEQHDLLEPCLFCRLLCGVALNRVKAGGYSDHGSIHRLPRMHEPLEFLEHFGHAGIGR